jgi:CubicO group peptidase (beta-lactamase class C family)
MRKLILITALFIYYSSFYAKSQDSDNQILISQFENQLASDVKEDNAGSISAAIVINNKLVWSKAFGFADPVKKVYADTSTIYRIASASKTFTVFLMMQMIEAGYFKLDDPIEKFVPEIKEIKGYSASTIITFRQLASHTAGLPKEPKLRNAALGPTEEWENKLLLSIPTISFIEKPGIKHNYSNIGIAILGLAISRAANKPFIDMIFENILLPLNLNNSFYKVPVADSNRLSLGIYGSRFNKRNIRIANAERNGRGYKVPAGGLLTTPTDLGNFMLALMGKSEKKVITDESLRLMQTPIVKSDFDSYYGLGLFISKTDSLTIIGHGGKALGYSSLFCFDKFHNNGVVLMRNYNTGKTNLDTCAVTLLRQLALK